MHIRAPTLAYQQTHEHVTHTCTHTHGGGGAGKAEIERKIFRANEKDNLHFGTRILPFWFKKSLQDSISGWKKSAVL